MNSNGDNLVRFIEGRTRCFNEGLLYIQMYDMRTY